MPVEGKLDAVRILDNRSLKIIAMVSMFIDHMGAVLFPDILIFRIIGRMAFPIYAFLLCEGSIYTHNMRAYMLRMGIFGLISEVIFNLAFYDSFFYAGHQNVFFTLLIGLVMIWFLDHPVAAGVNTGDTVYKVAVFLAAGAAAQLLCTDYGFYGIAVIFILYFFRERMGLKYILSAAVLIFMGGTEVFAVAGLAATLLYNGRRGRVTRFMQYGFYAFYPAHLLVLEAVSQLAF